jgi:hypothetical protein
VGGRVGSHHVDESLRKNPRPSRRAGWAAEESGGAAPPPTRDATCPSHSRAKKSSYESALELGGIWRSCRLSTVTPTNWWPRTNHIKCVLAPIASSDRSHRVRGDESEIGPSQMMNSAVRSLG